MNNGHYKSYIKNSDYYKNLSQAKELINELSNDISNLKLALNDATGDIINEMTRDLVELEKELGSYKDTINSIQNDLNANAALFDGVYTNWQGKLEEVYDSGYFIENFKYSISPNSNTENSTLPLKDVCFVNSIDEIPCPSLKGVNNMISYYKYDTKLSKVSIGSVDNAIHLEYTDYYYCYTVERPNVYEMVCWDDLAKKIFQPENRDTSRDYSKMSGACKIDFSIQNRSYNF